VDVAAQPTLATRRLVLRPFRGEDAAEVTRLAGDRAVADTTLNIPHPYEAGMAEAWIATHRLLFEQRAQATFAVTRDGVLVGACGLLSDPDGRGAELGYWLGRPWWGRGYATEAAGAVVAWAFDALDVARVYAHCMVRNPASRRVLEKLGMRPVAYLPGYLEKWGVAEDVELFAVTTDGSAPGWVGC